MTSESYFEVVSHPYKFHAYVLNQFGNITVKFGGKHACVDYVFHEDEEHPVLRGISYDKSCAENLTEPGKGLIPRVGTVTMLKASIYFIYSQWPDKGDIEFRDDSSIPCEEKDAYGLDVRVKLYILYLFKHRKTWYQDRVGATLRSPQGAQELEGFKTFLKRKKNRVEFDEFIKTYIPEGTLRRRKREDVIQKLRQVYDNHKTYGGFLKDVAKTYDCAIFDTWSEIFFRRHCSTIFDLYEWVIPKGELGWESYRMSVKSMEDAPAFRPNIYAGGGRKEYMLHLLDAE